MDDDDDIIPPLRAIKFKPIDVAIVAVDGIASFFGVAESILDQVTRIMCSHANWIVERERVALEMRESIERITQE